MFYGALYLSRVLSSRNPMVIMGGFFMRQTR